MPFLFIDLELSWRVPEKEPFKDGWSDDGEIQYVEEQLSKVNRLPLNTAVSGML